MLANRWITKVEFHQVVVAGPSLVVKRFAVRAPPAEVQVIPIAVRRRSTLLAYVAKGPKIPPRMIEHSIDHDPNAAAMKLFAELGQHRVVTQPSVNAKVIGNVVAVRARFEYGSQQQSIDAELFEIVDPLHQLQQPARGRFGERIPRGRPKTSQRKQMIEDCLLNPRTHGVTTLRLLVLLVLSS